MQHPIVLINPAMAIGSRYYEPLVASFESHGWEARALTRRGFEEDLPTASRRDDWSYADEIADLDAQSDDLKNRIRVVKLNSHRLVEQDEYIHLILGDFKCGL